MNKSSLLRGQSAKHQCSDCSLIYYRSGSCDSCGGTLEVMPTKPERRLQRNRLAAGLILVILVLLGGGVLWNLRGTETVKKMMRSVDSSPTSNH